jgi:hypothetical protein
MVNYIISNNILSVYNYYIMFIIPILLIITLLFYFIIYSYNDGAIDEFISKL